LNEREIFGIKDELIEVVDGVKVSDIETMYKYKIIDIHWNKY